MSPAGTWHLLRIAELSDQLFSQRVSPAMAWAGGLLRTSLQKLANISVRGRKGGV